MVAGWFSESFGMFVDLRGIWFDGQTSVVVGMVGIALHSTAFGVWSPKFIGFFFDLNDVNGKDFSDLFVVGDVGLLLYYDGSVWSKVGNLVIDNLLVLEQVGVEGTVFVVGVGGTVVFDVSGIWEKTIMLTMSDFFDVWGVDQ